MKSQRLSDKNKLSSRIIKVSLKILVILMAISLGYIFIYPDGINNRVPHVILFSGGLIVLMIVYFRQKHK